MGFVADALGFGGRENAPGRAAEAQRGFNQQAIDEIRNQFQITQQNLQPFLQAGTGQLGALQEGTTAEGLDARLGRIFDTDIFKRTFKEAERAGRNQLAAGGQTRSGFGLQQAARLPTDIGLAIENLLTGRSGALAGQGLTAGLNLGQFSGQASGNIANILGASGAATSQGILGDAEALAAQKQKQFESFQKFGGRALGEFGTGGGFGAGGGGLGGFAQSIGNIFFSDPNLKENIEAIGEIKGLTLYQWDWIKAAKGTLIEKCPDIGFMADEVKEIYPQYISEFGGFMVIDYPALLDELEAA